MTRFLLLRQVAAGLIAVTSLQLVGTAAAQTTVPARGSASGQVILQINPTPEDPVGVQVYSAAGRSSLLGGYTQTGITLFTANGDVTGTAVWTTSDGSTFSFSYTGTVTPIPGTTDFLFDLEAVGGVGTGRLAGVTADIAGQVVLDGLTGAFHYDFGGIWILP